MNLLVDIVLFLFGRVFNSPGAKGQRGERRVAKALCKFLPPEDYVVLDSLTLPTENSTTQIDHTILSRFGIFVIETKNKDGWIFGSQYYRTWTQSFMRKSFEFQNPLRQNFLHVKVVADILGLSEKEVHNVVAFVGDAAPKSEFPENVVWCVEDLVHFVKQHNLVIIDPTRVQSLTLMLQNSDLGNDKTVNSQHNRNVATKVKEKAAKGPLCPRCGAQMMERQNKVSGDSFLGCSRFPSCRGTRQL